MNRNAIRSLGLVVLTLPIVIPLLRPGWIQSHEGLSYPIRLVEVLECWNDGLLSARWFPDLNHGQGYPFLSFYAPLLFWAAGLFARIGFDLATALKLVTAGGVLAAAFGVDALVRESFWRPTENSSRSPDGVAHGVPPRPSSNGHLAGFLAAALFTYAPYAVRDIFIRGDLAESLALGLLPFALWGLFRLRRTTGTRAIGISALLGAFPLLAHNIMGLFTGALLAVFGAVLLLTHRPFRPLVPRLVASGLGTLALSAFFWLPALLEKRHVQIDVMTEGDFDVLSHFVSLPQLLGRGEFPGIGQGLPMTFEIGWVGLAGVVVALACAPRLWSRHRAMTLLGAFLFFAGVSRTMEISRPVYEAVALLQYVQFPWRFLSLVALGAAILGGLGIDALLHRLQTSSRFVAAAIVTVAAIAFVAPLLGPKSNFTLPAWAVSPEDLTKSRDTTTKGEYLPKGVVAIDVPRGFTEGVKPPAASTLHQAKRRAGRITASLEASAAGHLEIQDVYFPGWTATVNGRPQPIQVAHPSGRMLVPVEIGSNEIEVRLQGTPLRKLTLGVSVVFACVVLLACLVDYSPKRSA